MIEELRKPFFRSTRSQLYLKNTLSFLDKLPEKSFDMIFADPPYFLSNGGITCSSGKMVSVDKADWDKTNSFKDKHSFNLKWISKCKRVLKDDGTIWISGTLHNIYSIGVALESTGWKIINNITWVKTNPPPNLACRCFTHSTETILWAKKADVKKSKTHYFDYQEMKRENGGKQMRDVWVGTLTPQREKKYGKHPTQKPEYLLERIIRSATRENALILDPFCGSGTTGVVAIRLGREFVGIDNNADYLEIAKQRIINEMGELYV
jgi:site-specific DNA-methyltransferase (adenine-specific)